MVFSLKFAHFFKQNLIEANLWPPFLSACEQTGSEIFAVSRTCAIWKATSRGVLLTNRLQFFTSNWSRGVSGGRLRTINKHNSTAKWVFSVQRQTLTRANLPFESLLIQPTYKTDLFRIIKPNWVWWDDAIEIKVRVFLRWAGSDVEFSIIL